MALWRHGFLVFDRQEQDLVEAAVLDVAGEDDRAAGAVCKGLGAGFQVQVAHESAGVMAVDAATFDDGADGGDKIDWRFCGGCGVSSGFAGWEPKGKGGGAGEGEAWRRDEIPSHAGSIACKGGKRKG